MQAYPSREEDLDQLCRTIRGKLEHLPDPETEALLKMLEKPPFEDEAGRIIRELDEMEKSPPAPPAGQEREKGSLPDGFMKASPQGKRQKKRKPREPEEIPKSRHPAAAVMLITFSAVLVAGAAFIISSCREEGTEEIPATPASLCDAGTAEDGGYTLGVDGEFLAVYQNGTLRETLRFPIGQLTEYDQTLLRDGIRLEHEAALRRAIEDYTS